MSPAKHLAWGIFLMACLDSALLAKILFLFPIEFRSHFRAFAPVVEELAIRGHEITAYVHPQFKRREPLQNYKEILVDTDSYAPTSIDGFNFVEMRKATVFKFMQTAWTFIPTLTEGALKTPALRELMKSEEHFDLIIMEATMYQEPFLAFAHKFGAPVVNLNPFSVAGLMVPLTGSPNSLSFVPDFRLPYTECMSFWQRVHNVIFTAFDVVGGSLYFLPSQEDIMRRNFQSEAIPPLKTLIANISLHLALAHPMMHVRPLSSNVVQVSGMHIKPARELPSDLQKFMDEAVEGVIYFSLGSLLKPSLLPDHVKSNIIETLKNLKQRVILKWPDKIDGNPKNILQKAWLPQTDILAHPNCKLFITHGGMSSLVEVMNAGVPVLGLPFFSDQYHNVAYYEHIGVGLGARIDDLTIEDFRGKINKILYTNEFAENAKRWTNIYRDLPKTSLEKAVFWIEYVIRHKGAHHLKPASVSMPFYKEMLLDVIAFCAAAFILIIWILIWLIRETLFYVLQCTKKTQKITNAHKKDE